MTCSAYGPSTWPFSRCAHVSGCVCGCASACTSAGISGSEGAIICASGVCPSGVCPSGVCTGGVCHDCDSPGCMRFGRECGAGLGSGLGSTFDAAVSSPGRSARASEESGAGGRPGSPVAGRFSAPAEFADELSGSLMRFPLRCYFDARRPRAVMPLAPSTSAAATSGSIISCCPVMAYPREGSPLVRGAGAVGRLTTLVRAR